MSRRLCRIKGYTEAQVRRFNEMYNALRSYELADEEDRSEMVPPSYEKEELDSLQSFVILAELDESRRMAAMREKQSVEDYTQEEVAHFEYMMEVLDAYNKLMADDEIEPHEIGDVYSEIEMAEISQYRQMVLHKEVSEFMKEFMKTPGSDISKEDQQMG